MPSRPVRMPGGRPALGPAPAAVAARARLCLLAGLGLLLLDGLGAVGRTDDASPAPVRFGGEIRLRGEAFENLLDLDATADDAYGFWRLRYRLWADAAPRERLRIYLRLGNEYRWGVYEGNVRGNDVFAAASIRDPESRISLENGWAEIGAGAPVRFRFGRMDLFYGEGFLVFDGTPADGSASAFFDALRLSWDSGGGTTDFFAAKLVDEGFGTAADDEDLYGLYHHGERLDAYFLHRIQRSDLMTASGIVHPRQHTSAAGGRIAILPEVGWRLAAEGAFQIGKRGPAASSIIPGPEDDSDLISSGARNDRRGWGGYLRGGYVAGAPHGAGIEVGALYLSGDDPGTTVYEGWDGFYSEWPKWSELLVYTLYDNTTRVERGGDDPRGDEGTWTNLTAAWLEARIRPRREMEVALRGTWLGAPEATGWTTSRSRGFVAAGRIDVTPSPGIVCQALGEFFVPGDYYAAGGCSSCGTGADNAVYGRLQVTAGF